jgi:hypothetical protein
VVIAARAMPVVLRPAHVNSFYISAAESSTSRQIGRWRRLTEEWI